MTDPMNNKPNQELIQSIQKNNTSFVTPFIIFGILLISIIAFYVFHWMKGDTTLIPTSLNEFLSDDFSALTETSPTKTPTSFHIENYIRPHNPTFGNPDSPIHILAFIDFECPFCQRSYPIFEQIKQKYADDVHIVFKHLPVDELHPNASTAAIAAQCAHEQNAFWEYYDAIFTYKNLDAQSLLDYAKNIGLNTIEFLDCTEKPIIDSQLQNDLFDAYSLGVAGTPTYFINSIRLQGVHQMDVWDAAILQAIQKK